MLAPPVPAINPFILTPPLYTTNPVNMVVEAVMVIAAPLEMVIAPPQDREIIPALVVKSIAPVPTVDKVIAPTPNVSAVIAPPPAHVKFTLPIVVVKTLKLPVPKLKLTLPVPRVTLKTPLTSAILKKELDVAG